MYTDSLLFARNSAAAAVHGYSIRSIVDMHVYLGLKINTVS